MAEEETQEILEDKIVSDSQPSENPQEIQVEPTQEITEETVQEISAKPPQEITEETAEEIPAKPPQKVYQPANPTIKDCIILNQLLPISENDKNIDAISTLIYENDELLNEFLQKVDPRTFICNDDQKGPFIKCEQNRDGDSYRSPITNEYFPPTEDAKYPSAPLRQLEEKLNKIFTIYLKNYYSTNGNVSVYCWDFGEDIKEGFGVAVVIKNSLIHEKGVEGGSWDSSNVISVSFEESEGKINAKYSLFTTINISLLIKNNICGTVNLSGSLSRNTNTSKVVQDYTGDEQVENIGMLVEDLESSMRNTINTIYVMKSKEIIDTARFNPTYGKPGIEQAQALKNAFFGIQN